MQPLSSKYKRHCFLQVVCDKDINLFSLNDTAFLNRLAAEAILWGKEKKLGNCYRVSWKYAPNPILRVTVGVLLLSQTTCPWKRLLLKPPHLSPPIQNSMKAQLSCPQGDCIAHLISSIPWQLNRCVCLDRVEGPSSQTINRCVLRERGEGLPHWGFLMSFRIRKVSWCWGWWCSSECLQALLVWVWGRSWGHLHGYTMGIWDCQGALSEDP